MGRSAVDPVRRLTLALLLASVAALGASVDDAPDDDARTSASPSRSRNVVPLRSGAATTYDERRCSERGLNPN
jgi:hypothetical protein